MGAISNTVAEILARIARRQHGVVARRQLLAAGVTSRQVGCCLIRGTLIPIHRGVYRVGHAAPSTEATYMAAVLVCGEGALLACRAAAFLLGLIRGGPPAPEVVALKLHRVPGVRSRRARLLDSSEQMIFNAIPVTSVPRTLVDLAADLPPAELARACHEAGVKYKTTPRQIERVLARRNNYPGAVRLRAVISGDVKVSLSRLESRFLELLRSRGLPLPSTNRPAGAHRVDCRWPEHKLTVELDSYRYHRSRHAWEQDRRREREAYTRGDQIRRFTWGDVFERPLPMLRELDELLAFQV